MNPLLSVIIVVFNRREALARTLAEVFAALERLAASTAPNSNGTPPGWLDLAEVIVVDNASTDGSTEGLEGRFPGCRVLLLERNTGVAAFNRGVEAARGKYVLILDDDAWPEGASASQTAHAGAIGVQGQSAPTPGRPSAQVHGEGVVDALSAAVAFLEREPGVAAIMLQPVHPRTGALEWPFDRVREPTRDWADLRCANLVRREAWNAVGGYEERFFLYRNDTDLALKLLGSGRDIAYNPAWRAMHDSPHIAVRRVRWFYLSTRNWCWMCRRHARGMAAVGAMLLGWLWAHRLAGWSLTRQWSALRGGLEGVLRAFPRAPAGVRRDGRALGRLIELKRALRRG